MLRNHEEVERHQNILHIGYEVRPILNELVHANTSHSVDTIGNGKHFTTMFKRKISRNQSPALFRCLSDQYTLTEACDNAVPCWEVLLVRFAAQRQLR